MDDKNPTLTCLLSPHARELVKLDGPLLAALVHLHPPGLHLSVEPVLLLVQRHLVGVGLASLQAGADAGSALSPLLAVVQHLGGLLQAVGRPVPCLTLSLSPVYPGSEASDHKKSYYF